MQYDGSIRINALLNTQDFNRGAQNLKANMQKLCGSINGMMGALGFALGIAGLVRLGKEAVETASDISEVQNVVDTAFGSMAYKMEQFADVAVKQFGMSRLSAKEMGSTFMAMGASMVDSMEDASDMAIALTGRAADMASFYNKSAQETATALKSIYTGETETLKTYGVVMTEVNLQEYAAEKGIRKKISAMSQAEKVQLRYNYVMEQTSLAAGDFAKTSDSWANQTRILSEQFKELLSVIGGGLITAFTPVVRFLNTVLSQLIVIAQQVGAVLSRLLGISIPVADTKKFSEDMSAAAGGAEDVADGIEEAGKQAKKALAPFDDLMVLADKGGGGKNGAGAGAAGGGFEMPKLDMKDSADGAGEMGDALDGLLSRIEPVIEKMRELRELFSIGFSDAFGGFDGRAESVRLAIGSIGESLRGIFTDPSVLGAADAWASSAAYALGSLAGMVGSIGLTIGENLVGGLALYLQQSGESIKGYLTSMFNIGDDINGILAELFQSISYVFEAFASESGVTLTANLIGMFAEAFMGVTEIAMKFARDILNIFVQPFVDNKEAFRAALEGFLGVLSTVAGTIRRGIEDTFKKMNEVYDRHFKPFFDSIATGLSDTVEKFMKFWNEQMQPVLDEWAKTFDSVWKGHIQPMLNNFIELLGDLADFLKALWENSLKPIIDWVVENVLPVLLPVFDGIVQGVMVMAGYIADAVSGIIDVFRGVIEFLTGVFTGDWETAWGGVTKIFEGVKETLKGIINGILGGVETMANGVVKAINAMIRALNNFKVNFPDWVPLAGGKTLSFNLQELSEVKIPRLATGAVIRGGNPFLAMLGDQPAGRVNVEAPADLIRDMARQGIREELSGLNLGGRGANQVISLNVDGQEFARLTLGDFFSEMNRQGYDVQVLGYT